MESSTSRAPPGSRPTGSSSTGTTSPTPNCAALELGVGRIVADSFDELDHLEKLAADVDASPEVLVRITPGVEAHTHEYIETGTEDSKFGFTVSRGIALAAIERVVASPQLQFAGLHCHIGSQIQRLDPWDGAVAVLADLARQLPRRGAGPGAEPGGRARSPLSRR